MQNGSAGRVEGLVDLYRRIYEDPKNPDFPKLLKEHGSRIRKLTQEEEWKYYERIHSEIIFVV